MLEKQNILMIAVTDFFFPPAYSAITGLEPVEGATVELIRVDNAGLQIGDVLIQGTTTITGDYTLTLPAGVSLAGNLIVRITGTGGQEMRAQVVEETVDINPATEFVLQKFVDQGADLENLTTASVIRLTGQVEEFDLTAGANLNSMLDKLEQETGVFIEEQIAVIDATAGDGSTIAGSYRGIEISPGLHDDDQKYGVGTLSVDAGVFEFAITDQGSGNIDLTFGLEDDVYSNQSFDINNGNVSLDYVVETDQGSNEAEPAQIDSSGVFSLEAPFEEDIYGDFGWRWPPSLLKLQKAKNANIFFGTTSEAGVRYRTVDTNSDGIKDAVDPNQREGDEVFRSALTFAEQPASMTTADLSGDYGRVYFELSLTANGSYNVRTEQGILSFDGVGLLDISQTDIQDIGRTASGADLSYATSIDPAEAGIPYSISNSGKTFTVGGVDQDAMSSADFGLLAILGIEKIEDANPADELVSAALYGITYALKLPASQLDISNRVYRVFFLGVSLTQNGTALATERFSSTLTVNNDGTSASINSRLLEVEKATPTAEVTAFNEETAVSLAGPVTLAANGATSIVLSDAYGTFEYHGYFSQDGSIGIFNSSAADTGLSPDELGLVFLVEI